MKKAYTKPFKERVLYRPNKNEIDRYWTRDCIVVPSEIPFIYDNITKSYKIEKRKIDRYAGRRDKTQQIKKYLGDEG